MDLPKIVADAWKKSDHELFAELGARAYVSEGRIIHKRSTGGPDDEKNGRKVFDALLPKIRTRVCDDWRGCEKLKLNNDETATALLLADWFITAKVAAFPVATLTVLTMRIGIKRLCGCPT